MTHIPGAKPNKQKRLETIEFIKEIADRMFIPEETVAAIWDTSVAIITEALQKEERVVIRKFGVFRLSRLGTAKFKAADTLKKILRESNMEKYGVEINNEAVLMARITGACPTCKGQLDSKDPPHCPSCGTKPFEETKANRASVSHQNSINRNFATMYGVPPDEEE